VAHLRQQRKAAAKRGQQLGGKECAHYNPLTEEEEYVLSSHLRRKAATENSVVYNHGTILIISLLNFHFLTRTSRCKAKKELIEKLITEREV